MAYDTGVGTLDQAQAALEDGNIDAAMEHYRALIEAGGPHKPTALFGLASCHARRKEWGEAETTLNQVLDYAPDFATAYAYRGAVRLELGRMDDAMKDLDRAAEMAPADAIVHVKRAEVFLRLGLLPAAHDEVRLAAKLPAPDLVFRDYTRAMVRGIEKELKSSVTRTTPPIEWGRLRPSRWLRRSQSLASATQSE
jgi:tetratricopeptide (TPR) repeat protein